MQYEYIMASTEPEAILRAREKYGNEISFISSKKVPQKGLLGKFRKEMVQCIFSIPEDVYLKRGSVVRTNSSVETVERSKSKVEKYEEETLSFNQQLLEKMERLERKIETQNVKTEDSSIVVKNLQELREILENNEFSNLFIEELLENIRSTLPLKQTEKRLEVQKYAYNYLADKVSKIIGTDAVLYENDKNVMVLVGPTGIGKTTTLAKIAANSKLKEKKEVEFITIDSYRIGAISQLQRYAELLQIGSTYADSEEMLNKTILISNGSLILVDTTGRSQQDNLKLAEMRNLLRMKNIPANFVLAVSATTKPKEVRNIFKNFSIFDYEQVIITKIDESDTIGSILSCAIEFKKKIMFCTNGQKVPTNIEKVSVDSLMQKITGFASEVYLEHIEF